MTLLPMSSKYASRMYVIEKTEYFTAGATIK